MNFHFEGRPYCWGAKIDSQAPVLRLVRRSPRADFMNYILIGSKGIYSVVCVKKTCEMRTRTVFGENCGFNMTID